MLFQRSKFHFLFFLYGYGHHRDLHSFPTRRSSDLGWPSCTPKKLRLGCANSKPGAQFSTAQRMAEFSSATLAVTSIRGWRMRSKSTRLNSSHVSISYAVFCLKKKK